MSTAVGTPMTLAEFLDWEERQALRYEFDGFRPVGLAGGTIAHDRITFNIRRVLADRLAGKPSRPLGPSVKIIADGHVYYPDAFVTCSRVAPSATVADDPVTVFEVTSEGSYQADVIVKNRSYRATSSIQRYIIVQQSQKAAIVFVRRGQGWLATGVKVAGRALPGSAIAETTSQSAASADHAYWRGQTGLADRDFYHEGRQACTKDAPRFFETSTT